MASYLYTTLFFCDRTLVRPPDLGAGDLLMQFKGERPCLRASSRHGASADSIAALLSAKGSRETHLDFIASKGKWPYDEPCVSILPFDSLIPIAESIDDLLAWSAQSVAQVARILNADFAAEIQNALEAPPISANPNEAPGVDFDGDRASFLFSFLASIASLAREAHASRRTLICIRA